MSEEEKNDKDLVFYRNLSKELRLAIYEAVEMLTHVQSQKPCKSAPAEIRRIGDLADKALKVLQPYHYKPIKSTIAKEK